MSENFLSREDEIKEWNSRTMKLDFSPATWTCKKPKYNDVTKIRMTYGGGMGGANYIIFVLEKRDHLKPNTLVEVTDFLTGEKSTINTSFMVDAKDVVIASVTFITQHWDLARNYGFKEGKGTIHKLIPTKYKNKIILG